MKVFYLVISIVVGFSIISCKKSSSSEIEGFKSLEGYVLEIVASEPLISDPVDLEFDENGDAYVLEMPGYPFEDKHSRIVNLKDKDGDGEYDDMIVYAESLQLASSILPYNKGILVAGPPYLLFVKDTDGDGFADHRDTLMGGFSTGNLQHNYNGLTYGLDNWIYAANGGNSGNPYWWGDSSSVIDLRGDDMRIDLEKRIIERIGYSSGGYELAIDDYGRIFETHNLEHISQSVFSNKYIADYSLLIDHTLQNVSDHEENGLARIYPIGEQESRVNHPEQSGYFSGACGITYYGGGNMTEELNQSIWVADVVLNLIHVDQLSPKGAAFSASRVGVKRDFLASTDRSFRPVNLTVGPDGSMYVVDMYREVIEHPEWIPDEIEKTLDLEAGKDKGRLYKVSKENSQSVEYKFTETRDLIESLGNKNQWVRNTAQRLILETPNSSEIVDLLNASSSSKNPLTRLHVMWILHHMNEIEIAGILKSLNDEVVGNRENALKISEFYISGSEVLQSQIIEMLVDKDQRVRMQAALSLSTLSDQDLLKLETVILAKLKEIVSLEMDKWNIAAMSLLCRPFSHKALFSIASLDEFVSKNDLIQSFTSISTQSTIGIEEIIQSIAKSGLTDEIKEKIVSVIADQSEGISKSNHLLSSIKSLEKTESHSFLAELSKLRMRIGYLPSQKFVSQSGKSIDIVNENTNDAETRLEHLKIVDLLPFDKKSDLLYSLLSNVTPLDLQSASLTQLWEANDPNIGTELVNKWKELGPQSRKTASDILLYKEVHHDALLSGLEEGVINIGEMNFDLERRRTLLWWTDNQDTKDRAGKLFSDSGVLNRKEAMDSMKIALDLNGSISDGGLVFDQLCGQCHIYENRGNDVGPVLTENQRKSKESLLHDILDPNAGVDTKYINHKIETNDGKLVFGMVEKETDLLVTLKNSGGIETTIKKSDIKSYTSLGTSLMMEGLEASLSHQDMADLLAFLQQSI